MMILMVMDFSFIPRKRTIQKAYSVVPTSLLYDLLMTPKV